MSTVPRKGTCIVHLIGDDGHQVYAFDELTLETPGAWPPGAVPEVVLRGAGPYAAAANDTIDGAVLSLMQLAIRRATEAEREAAVVRKLQPTSAQLRDAKREGYEEALAALRDGNPYTPDDDDDAYDDAERDDS